jgi:hypothetical protein
MSPLSSSIFLRIAGIDNQIRCANHPSYERKLKIPLLPISIAVLAFLSFHCSTAKPVIPETRVVYGKIYSIGNEPFTKLGIQTSDGTMYIVKCTKEIEALLSTKQGQFINVHYETIISTPEGLILSVLKIIE